ncbi:MAG: pirin family protein [Bacteroidia bacterium]
MKRKDFLKKSIGTLAIGALVGANSADAKQDVRDLQTGFNHLPPIKPDYMENTVIHRAATRGHANHGWLNSHHTFSFSQYYNPERMSFGVLRVLNDDVIDGGTGFGTHPHNNMEIISIPLSGDLEHKDSMGTVQVIKQDDIQVMSAGSGITHSEYNHSEEEKTNFLQIWVIPNKQNVPPRYDQINISPELRKNKLAQILSPSPDDEGVWIHQNAWFHRGSLEKGLKTNHALKNKSNGIYVFVLDGSLKINGTELLRRDGMGLWSKESIAIEVTENSDILLMEVPMNA